MQIQLRAEVLKLSDFIIYTFAGKGVRSVEKQ
jgi:hypothetical protein